MHHSRTPDLVLRSENTVAFGRRCISYSLCLLLMVLGAGLPRQALAQNPAAQPAQVQNHAQEPVPVQEHAQEPVPVQKYTQQQAAHRTTAFEGILEGTRIGAFRAAALYEAAGSGAVGARFIHDPSGMPVDLLRFDSVPQAMVWVQTLPVSDRGEPHTGEHLVLGKGKKGRLLALMLDMSIGEGSAATWRSKTIYHFHTAGGRQSFLELTYRLLDTLFHPDFTDEEIRREVAHLGVVEDVETGLLSLEEKGTIYLEMLSSFEKPGCIIWNEAMRLAYGPGHPLGFVSGGRPEAIRTMEPKHIREYFCRCYVPGETVGLIVGLPEQFELRRFLTDLDGVIRKVCNGHPHNRGAAEEAPLYQAGTGAEVAKAAATVPPLNPPGQPLIRLLSFPSASSSEPGNAVFSWAPRANLSPTDLFRLRALWHVLAGDEASYLHKDLVDRSTRRVAPGIAHVSGWISAPEGHPAMLWLSGLAPEMLDPAALGRVRGVIADRLEWIASLGPGSAELSEVNEKARTYLIALRRNLVEQTETPPRFGYRGTDDFWYRHVRQLAAEPGFRKDLLLNRHRKALEVEMVAVNVWRDLITRLGLAVPPVCVAARPDTSLPRELSEDKRKRLGEALEELKLRYAVGDEQEALRRYRADFDAETAKLEATEPEITRPGFLRDPPLTLDAMIDSEVELLILETPTGAEADIPVCLSRFGRTSLVDMGLYFDVTSTEADDLIYLPLLPLLIADLGCRDEDAGWLPYDRLRQRLQREVRDLEARYSVNPREGGSRVEWAVYASGLGSDEARAALSWMNRLLESAGGIEPPALPRLRDLVNREIASLRQLPLGEEEDWATNPAQAYRYQRDRAYLSTTSIFTKLHHLNRLSWRLQQPPATETIRLLESRLSEILERWDGTREGLTAELDLMGAEIPPLPPLARELTAYLRTELDGAPDETLRDDLARLYAQTLGDLLIAPRTVLADLSGLVRRLLRQGPSRAHLTGSAQNVDRLLPQLELAIAQLVEGAAAAPANPDHGSVEADPGSRDGSHLGSGEGRAGLGANRLGPGIVTENLRSRYPWIPRGPGSRIPYAALRLESSRNVLFANTARLITYSNPRRSNLIDYLASKAFGGGGAHGLFMKTWGAGLAYSNGVGSSPRSGLASYYAERCSDGIETIRFVIEILREADRILDGPFFLDYALANTFYDYRGGDTYLSRGRAMADDRADGITPECVRRFKQGLLRLRREWLLLEVASTSIAGLGDGHLLQMIRDRLPEVVGPLLVGYGSRAAERHGSVNFMIGPEFQIEAFEKFLEIHEPGARLVRLRPRDFWID